MTTPTQQLRTACEDVLRYMDIPDCGRTEAPLEALRAALTAVDDEKARLAALVVPQHRRGRREY